MNNSNTIQRLVKVKHIFSLIINYGVCNCNKNKESKGHSKLIRKLTNLLEKKPRETNKKYKRPQYVPFT